LGIAGSRAIEREENDKAIVKDWFKQVLWNTLPVNRPC